MQQSKKTFWVIVIALAVPAVGATWFSWGVFRQVRAEAAVTDARLRELAWCVLAYADEFDAFPVDESQLRAFTLAPDGVRERLTKPAPAGAEHTYPVVRVDAGTMTPAPTLDECLGVIDVEWGIAADVQPILRSKGKATLQGTVPTVGGWLYAMHERLRAR